MDQKPHAVFLNWVAEPDFINLCAPNCRARVMQVNIRSASLIMNINKEFAMKSILKIILIPVFVMALSASVWADSDDNSFKAKLEGYQEVPTLSSPGSGKFSASLLPDGSLQYVISYQNLQGTPFMSHIHLGNRGTNGGIMVWLCGNAPATPPVGTPACPVPSGSATGILTADQVVGPAAQFIAAGELAEVIKALKAGAAYVNVHSSLVPTGEIRGQIKRNDHD
jgi:hypothetical protein